MPQAQRLPETAFEQNLASYVEANQGSHPNDFKVKRELDIARHALEESLTLHSLVTKAVRGAINSLGESEQDLVKTIALANSLEERHRKLQNSAKTVASIAKSGAEIESILSSKLDAAQVYSILVQLPALILTILQAQMLEYMRAQNLSLINGEVLSPREIENHVTELANTVANALHDEIDKSVNVLTYGGNDKPEDLAKNGDGTISVVEEQVVAMLQTVPTGVVESDSPTAALIESVDSKPDNSENAQGNNNE